MAEASCCQSFSLALAGSLQKYSGDVLKQCHTSAAEVANKAVAVHVSLSDLLMTAMQQVIYQEQPRGARKLKCFMGSGTNLLAAK